MHMCLFIIRNLWCVVVTMIVALQSATTASARIEVPLSIQRYFESADVVVEVRIDNEEPVYERQKWCGSRYHGTVLQKFKDLRQISTQQFIFGRSAGLIPGETYLLFLRYETDPEAIYRQIKERYDPPDPNTSEEKEQIIRWIKCNGLVPGLAFLVYGGTTVWTVRLDDVVIESFLPEDFPQDVRRRQVDPITWLIQKDDLFAYLRSLGNMQK